MKDKSEIFFTWSTRILSIHKPVATSETTWKVISAKFYCTYADVAIWYWNLHMIISQGIMNETIAEAHWNYRVVLSEWEEIPCAK